MLPMTRREFSSALAAGAAAPQGGRWTVERLGYPASAKLLMVHADDAGMCHSANLATMEAMEKGSVSSTSVMAPCTWFGEFADWARRNEGKDIGLHLTLTSEWKYYRWRPLAPAPQVKSLIDPEGYTWRDVRDVATRATAAEVETELRAQIDKARAAGIRFTHLDTHMGTLFARPDYFEVYSRLARECRVPCMLPRPTPEAAAEMKGYPITPEMLSKKEAEGHVLLDRLATGVPGRTVEERRESYRRFLAALQPGVTKLIIHLAKDDQEIRAVTGNWEQRWADFLFWSGAEARELLEKNSVRLTTYRELGKLLT
jgi:predicted glycoside hydrolase/deacetylase ChbG (UPF0249 family)